MCGDSLSEEYQLPVEDGGSKPTSPLQYTKDYISVRLPMSSEYHTLDLKMLKMMQIPFFLTKRFIVSNHYSHALASSVKVSVGFFLHDNLVTNIVYGCPVGRQVTKWLGVNYENCLELVRLFSKDGLPKNTESYCIGKSFLFLRQHYPQYKYLISYADPNHGHCGYIYQATNWRYIGPQRKILKQRRVFIDGIEVHIRTLNAKHGSSSDALLMEIYGDRIKIIGALKKHVYIMCLGNKAERNQWYGRFTFLPYPKAINNLIQGNAQ